MVRTSSRIALTVSFTLIAAVNLLAREDSGEHCTTRNFRGVFAALVEGELEFGPPGSTPGPISRISRVDLDGNGHASVQATTSTLGHISEESYDGVYSVNSDCTMTITFNVPFPGGIIIPVTFKGMLSGNARQSDIVSVMPGSVDRATLRQQSSDQCETGDLAGAFMVNMNGINLFGPGMLGRFARVGRVEFDGNGGFTASTRASHAGLITTETISSGTYLVGSDCRFTMNFTLDSLDYTWAGMLFDDSRQAYLLETAPEGAIITGTLRQQSDRRRNGDD